MKKLILVSMVVALAGAPLAAQAAGPHYGGHAQKYPKGWGPHHGPDGKGYYHGY